MGQPGESRKRGCEDYLHSARLPILRPGQGGAARPGAGSRSPAGRSASAVARCRSGGPPPSCRPAVRPVRPPPAARRAAAAGARDFDFGTSGPAQKTLAQARRSAAGPILRGCAASLSSRLCACGATGSGVLPAGMLGHQGSRRACAAFLCAQVSRGFGGGVPDAAKDLRRKPRICFTLAARAAR